MGNALAGRRRAAKVMTVDGATFRYKTPAAAGAALRGHPGHQLLESEEVRRLGVRARPLDRDAALKPGKLYFLVHLPRGAAGEGEGQGLRAPHKTWSGALHVGARERLESLMLSRRTVSDVASLMPSAAREPSSVEAGADGAVRLRMRLPKSEVARLMKESRDPAEAAERIMQLCVARDQGAAPAPPKPAALPASALCTNKTAIIKKEAWPITTPARPSHTQTTSSPILPCSSPSKQQTVNGMTRRTAMRHGSVQTPLLITNANGMDGGSARTYYIFRAGEGSVATWRAAPFGGVRYVWFLPAPHLRRALLTSTSLCLLVARPR